MSKRPSQNEIEFIHESGGKVHPKSDKLGRGRWIPHISGKPLTPIKYKSRERALNDLRNLGLVS